MNKDQVFGLSTNAKKWLVAWKDAAGAPDADYTKLPLLDAAQIAKFYVAINEGITPNSESLQPGDAEAKKDLLLSAVTYYNEALTKVGWLQWMMFICSLGMPPLRSEYTANARFLSLNISYFE